MESLQAIQYSTGTAAFFRQLSMNRDNTQYVDDAVPGSHICRLKIPCGEAGE